MKKIHTLICGTMFCVMFSFSACNLVTNGEKSVVTPEQRSYAENQINNAYNEIHEILNNKARSVSSEINPEDSTTWTLADRLEAAAWSDLLNDSFDETEKLAKETGVYDIILDIVKKYDVENCVKIRDAAATSSAENSSARTISKETIAAYTKTGDIFLSHSDNSSQYGSTVAVLNALTRGYYKHSGIIDRRRTGDACILSASNNNDHFKNGVDSGLGAVGYEYISVWTGIEDRKVGVIRVKNATETQCNTALDAGKAWLGKPYGFSLDRNSDSQFYCSKVVYRCWLAAGYDLEYTSTFFPRGPFVTPQDLYDDADTVFVCGTSPE